MSKSPEVDQWLGASEHPQKDLMQRVRETILEADARVSETIKWKSPTFMYEGNLASIDPKARKHVAVLFHRGAEIPGDHPLLQGEGKLARFARFPDLDSAERGRDALIAVTRAWCDARG
jgi:hypothetical protein